MKRRPRRRPLRTRPACHAHVWRARLTSPPLGFVCAPPRADGGAVAPKEESVEDARKRRLLIICFCLMVVVGLGNRITNIVMYNYISNYPLFVNQCEWETSSPARSRALLARSRVPALARALLAGSRASRLRATAARSLAQ